MLAGLSNLFDAYGRQARLFPGLLTIFPALLCALAWFPQLLSGLGSTLLTIASSCGLLYALSSLARTKGKQAEDRLLKAWGGWPTTLLLRHSNGDLDSHTRQRYHAFLAKNANLPFPDAAAEARDPAAADTIYASAVKWLKERTRSKEFSLVEKENAQYGFRRNLRGMKPFGIALCAFAFALCLISVVFASKVEWMSFHSHPGDAILAVVSGEPAQRWGALFVNMAAIFGWLMVVSDQWVRQAGFQYAYALLACCDKLTIASSGRSRQKKAT